MGVDRPTFSEHWSALAQLRPRLRATVHIERVQHRNRRWRVICDAASQRFFRMNEGAWRFVGLLDGSRTVDEAWRLAQRICGDEAPTQGEAVALLGQLWSNDLLQADVPPRAQAVLRSRKTRWKKQAAGWAWQFLFLRIPLVDPDAFLQRWQPAVRWMFSPVGAMLWGAVVVTGAAQLLGRWEAFFVQGQGVLAPGNLPLLYAAFVAVKLTHELGHAFACKALAEKQGLRAEVRTLGLMLLVALPFPYVDASASWLLRRRRDRALVAAAGVLAELFLAAVALIVWARTAPGVVHALAHNVVIIASVSTLLFNGNPLLRYDAYYLLSDWLDIPNLSQRARQQWVSLIKRRFYRLPRVLPTTESRTEAAVLTGYGVLAVAYRLFLAGAIALYLMRVAPVVGVALAALVVGGLAAAPLLRGLWWLAASPELAGRRLRAAATTMVLTTAALTPLAAIPAPHRTRAPAVAKPAQRAAIYASAAGFVEHVTPDGAHVQRGDVLVRLSDPEAHSELLQLQAEQRAIEAQLRQARTEHPALAQALQVRLETHKRKVQQVQRSIDALTVTAPFAGVWVAPHAAQAEGGYVERGAYLGELVDVSRMELRAVLSQRKVDALAQVDAPVRIRLWGGAVANGKVVRTAPAGVRDATPTSSRASADEPVFFLDVALDPHAPPVLVGERAVVELSLPPQPLLTQWASALRSTLLWRLSE